ncbi:peroxisomal membrane anchor protein conserved region-domain-containing protein [Amylocarpus encephaloides]|uniref:Peroxisomal membrane protein PEX14 n=1 Tax=Amylocarpus encephaloides TaxID=45428 RepID=A0A9P8C083_9HELO|nr:peroxisomal membrane anchor protein conserved region-domain-containing protein [Amylocarpus encephaloides]
MSDSDEGEKEAGVPSWQQNSEQKPLKNDSKPIPEPPSQEAALDQARKFLEEDEVKNASTDKKIAFLESKGLRSEDIHELLGVSRNSEASSSTPVEESQTLPPLLEVSQSLNRSSIPPAQPSQTYTSPAPSQPPIITYPEFLTKPAHPEPLITKPRLLTTLYAFSAFSFLLYGTSNFLVAPMLASLTEARHDFASTASTNLRKLIEKLEALVSTIPDYAPKHKLLEEGELDGVESEDEDPTELFHRDIGVQTSPPQSPRSLSPAPQTPLDMQTTSLTNLTKSLQSLIVDSTSQGKNTAEAISAISTLTESLDSMVFVEPEVYTYGGGYRSTSGSGSGNEDDEIARVKAGIRGVKGVLLSARSFPGGVRAGR